LRPENKLLAQPEEEPEEDDNGLFACRGGPEDWPYVVCGFFTPDYWKWPPHLLESLSEFEQPYDLVEVPKLPGGWEINTMRKAMQILAAMDRHPDQVIIWIDVDCTVHGDLSPLAEIRGDVAFRMHSQFRQNHKCTRFRAQSGTMVFRPTAQARQFVENWRQASEAAAYGEIDQSSQVVAMARSKGTAFEPLDHRYCSNPPEKGMPGAVIQHASAAVEHPKVKGWRRFVGRRLGWKSTGR
jgi:hypothetical protein